MLEHASLCRCYGMSSGCGDDEFNARQCADAAGYLRTRDTHILRSLLEHEANHSHLMFTCLCDPRMVLVHQQLECGSYCMAHFCIVGSLLGVDSIRAWVKNARSGHAHAFGAHSMASIL